ncbi:hypothetical protein LWP59_05110 [Amycolatopsis acidiphila]|uniref:Uncharacterized protein n=1 Tax=Amycolatopsis acidiphila TaxID=715473 RepID=A0A558A183_9PSEU|nr:hypothetical protein [Amycolatopsis acidiphila]TVT18006.1 hypothetical protein FNH06_29250 [Amycolatopsis acidiphila]UIJ61042.1 hypothetical protein LWP59_05110 [Amycolatopsis acidiphila]GHG89043.1 hypothetical protein GCM10017788_63710 [Amycolatopsis acidiphila]
MPIRTNRGRAAVYRRLWGFPLRSPRHLAGTAIVVAILVIAIGIVVPQLLGPGPGNQVTPARIPDATSSAGQRPAGGSSVPMSTRLTAPLVQPTSAAPDPEAVNVAKLWAQAWVNHPAGITNAQWLDALRPYTTDEFLPQMSSVDPANIPASRLTGDPTATQSYTSSVQVLVPTDGPKLSITVSQTAAGWRVSDYDQAS